MNEFVGKNVFIRSTHRLTPAKGNTVEVGIGSDDFIAYSIELVNGYWHDAPNHPYAKEICRSYNKPWFGG